MIGNSWVDAVIRRVKIRNRRAGGVRLRRIVRLKGRFIRNRRGGGFRLRRIVRLRRRLSRSRVIRRMLIRNNRKLERLRRSIKFGVRQEAQMRLNQRVVRLNRRVLRLDQSQGKRITVSSPHFQVLNVLVKIRVKTNSRTGAKNSAGSSLGAKTSKSERGR